MAEIEITGGLGSALMHILEAEEIQPEIGRAHV